MIFFTFLITSLWLAASGAVAAQTNCGTDAHTIDAAEACSKMFYVKGLCGTPAPGFTGNIVWATSPWENRSITLVEIDYDIMLQGPASAAYYGSAFIGNTWTPDPMTPYRQAFALPQSGAPWGGLLLRERALSHGAQFPAMNEVKGQHLDLYLACTPAGTAFQGHVRIVYRLNPIIMGGQKILGKAR